MKKVCGIVVLYNPCNSVLKNISSYLPNIDRLYVVDNTEEKKRALIDTLNTLSKIQYIDNMGNRGIAHALNRGFQEALNNHYDFVLAMDQDSRFKPGDFARLLTSLENDQTIGIYAPLSFENELKLIPYADKVSITSGCIFDLNVYKNVGPFNNDLFIDSVDTEYCLRMNQMGYKLQRVPTIILNHKLGKTTKIKFLFWDFYTTNHSSLRRYYMTRNRFFLWKKFEVAYPEFVQFDKRSAFKELAKILLVENNKISKIWMSIKGYIDYKKNRFGKYNGAQDG